MFYYSLHALSCRYEATLHSMDIFKHLTHEQLAAIADCLTVEQYEVG